MKTALWTLGPIVMTGALACADSPTKHAGTSLTVWVLDEPSSPVAGARVAFDRPGADRVVMTTAADGHVTHEGDFARGGVSITVLSDDHVFVTLLEASPDSARARPNTAGKSPADLVVFPPRLDRVTVDRTVGLRGNISGKRDPSNTVALAVSSLSRLGTVRTAEPTYLLRAPRDRGFFILGHETKLVGDDKGGGVTELLKSFRIDLAPRSGDELLDLDLATAPSLPTRLVRMRAEAPAGSAFASAETTVTASLGSADSEVALGVFKGAKIGGDGTFDVDVAVAETDVGPERVLSEVALRSADGSRSIRTEQGPLVGGMVWRDFPAPPSITDPDVPRGARDPIPLDGFPAGADLMARVYAGGSLLWILYGPPGGPREKTFAIPYRDEVTEPLIQVFALSVSAMRERVALPERGEFYRYTSTFRDILLRKR